MLSSGQKNPRTLLPMTQSSAFRVTEHLMGDFCDGCTTLADASQDRMLHIALWCLEGTTMSNRRTPERSGGVLGHQPISTDAAWRAVPQRTGSPSVIRGLTPCLRRRKVPFLAPMKPFLYSHQASQAHRNFLIC